MEYNQNIGILARISKTLLRGIMVAGALFSSVGVCIAASCLEKTATISQTSSILLLVLLVLGALFTFLWHRLQK